MSLQFFSETTALPESLGATDNSKHTVTQDILTAKKDAICPVIDVNTGILSF